MQAKKICCLHKKFFGWRGQEEPAGWVRAFGGQSARRWSGPPDLYAAGKLLFIFSIGFLWTLPARPVFRLTRRQAAPAAESAPYFTPCGEEPLTGSIQGVPALWKWYESTGPSQWGLAKTPRPRRPLEAGAQSNSPQRARWRDWDAKKCCRSRERVPQNLRAI